MLLSLCEHLQVKFPHGLNLSQFWTKKSRSLSLTSTLNPSNDAEICSIRKVSSALGAPARSTNKPGLLGFNGVNSGGRLLHGHQTSNTTWSGGIASKPYMPSNPAPDLLPHLSPQITRKTFQTTISLLGSTHFSQCDQSIILPLFLSLLTLSSHGLLTGVACILFSFNLWRLRKKERLVKEVEIEKGKKGLNKWHTSDDV